MGARVGGWTCPTQQLAGHHTGAGDGFIKCNEAEKPVTPCTAANPCAWVQEEPRVESEGKVNEEGDGLVLLVELWRSDLVTSVVELDSEGNVMKTVEQQTALAELYPPGISCSYISLQAKVGCRFCTLVCVLHSCMHWCLTNVAGLVFGAGTRYMVEYHISAFLPQLEDR
jgi:hypothetical protein